MSTPIWLRSDRICYGERDRSCYLQVVEVGVTFKRTPLFVERHRLGDDGVGVVDKVVAILDRNVLLWRRLTTAEGSFAVRRRKGAEC